MERFFLKPRLKLFVTSSRFHHKIGKPVSFCRGFPTLVMAAIFPLCILLPHLPSSGLLRRIIQGGAPKAFGAYNMLLRSTNHCSRLL
jgi:hypothetical protein